MKYAFAVVNACAFMELFRFIAATSGDNIRFVGLSTALANAHDIADWLGVSEPGLFNFRPSVRPVPIEVIWRKQ